MKSRISKKEIDNEKSSAIFQQMKNCVLELGLNIYSEAALEGEMGIHAKLDLEDVRARLAIRYKSETRMISLFAVHEDLTEDELDAVVSFVPRMQEQFKIAKACKSHEIGVIGCIALMSVEREVLDVRYFRQVIGEVVKISRLISSFVCGLRDRCEGSPERVPKENLN